MRFSRKHRRRRRRSSFSEPDTRPFNGKHLMNSTRRSAYVWFINLLRTYFMACLKPKQREGRTKSTHMDARIENDCCWWCESLAQWVSWSTAATCPTIGNRDFRFRPSKAHGSVQSQLIEICVRTVDTREDRKGEKYRVSSVLRHRTYVAFVFEKFAQSALAPFRLKSTKLRRRRRAIQSRTEEKTKKRNN